MLLENKFKLKTIVAAVDKKHNAAIHIIRISGSKVKDVINSFETNMFSWVKPKNIYIHNYKKNSRVIDQISFIFYKGPNSYTGEDMLEVFNHGNAIITDYLVKDLISRFDLLEAKNGEFTKRAFINKKVDLLQADSIYKLTSVLEITELNSLNKELSGVFSQTITFVERYMRNIILNLEGSLENRFLTVDNFLIKKKAVVINKLVNCLLKKNNLLIRKRVCLSVIGSPNVGKSSMLNTLFKKKLSVVSLFKGTTRDIVVKEFRGMPVVFTDTAGVYQPGISNLNLIGISNTLKKLKVTDFYLWVVDIYTENCLLTKLFNVLLKYNNSVIVVNKGDFFKKHCKPPYLKVFLKKFKKFKTIHTSLIGKPAGIKRLKFLLFYSLKTLLSSFSMEGRWMFLLNKKQLNMLRHILSVLNLLNSWGGGSNVKKLTLVYSKLKKVRELGGGFSNEISLNSIFSKFCIGK